MFYRLLNLVLGLIFVILVFLFVYRESNKPEVIQSAISVKEPAVEATAAPVMNAATINKLIEDYIMNNPEVLIASLEELHNKKAASAAQKTSKFLENNQNDIENVEAPPFFGNKNGDIVIVSFYDYGCSFCKKASLSENAMLQLDSGIKLVLRPLPILGSNSTYIAKVVLAVHNISNHFPAIHNEIMKMNVIDESAIKSLLAKYNIDYSTIENEMNSATVKRALDKNFVLAQELGIRGTPSYIINGQLVPGLISLEQLKSIIMQIRAKI